MFYLIKILFIYLVILIISSCSNKEDKVLVEGANSEISSTVENETDEKDRSDEERLMMMMPVVLIQAAGPKEQRPGVRVDFHT